MIGQPKGWQGCWGICCATVSYSYRFLIVLYIHAGALLWSSGLGSGYKGKLELGGTAGRQLSGAGALGGGGGGGCGAEGLGLGSREAIAWAGSSRGWWGGTSSNNRPWCPAGLLGKQGSWIKARIPTDCFYLSRSKKYKLKVLIFFIHTWVDCAINLHRYSDAGIPIGGDAKWHILLLLI